MFFCKTWKKVLIAATMVVALCAPQAHASKDVVLAIASTLTTTDPWDANDTLSHACAKTFYEGLFGFNEKLELRPVLAESYDVSPDGLVYTFHLRKGVKFHDGTDFNAEAVKVNFDRVTNPENKLKRYSLYSNIAKTEVVDDLTAKVTLKTPFSPFINQLAHPSAVMISPTALKKYGKDIMFHPVGTGPYKFVEWKQTDYLKGAKNENYWRPGLPKIDTITWVPVVDNNARSAMMRTGEAHFTFPVPYEQAAVLEKDEHLKLVAAPSIVTRYLNMNMLQKPFDDLRVRQAINYAINKEALAKVAFSGYAFPSEGPLPQGVDYAVKLGPWPYNPKKAKELLAEAGYPNGFETTLWSAYNHTTGQKVIQFIQQQLAQVGIKAQVQALEAARGKGGKPSGCRHRARPPVLHRLVLLHRRSRLGPAPAVRRRQDSAFHVQHFLLQEPHCGRGHHEGARHHRPRRKDQAVHRSAGRNLEGCALGLPRDRKAALRDQQEADRHVRHA